jgi:hypothetical protein
MRQDGWMGRDVEIEAVDFSNSRRFFVRHVMDMHVLISPSSHPSSNHQLPVSYSS